MSTKYKKKVGTREQVWKDIAQQTSGGLRKRDLMISKTGKLVSKKASEAAKNRMKSGKGICAYCIKQYKGEIKNNNKNNKTKRVLKVKKIKTTGVTQKQVDELSKEIEKIRTKAGRIAEKEDRVTKAVKDLMAKVREKTKELFALKRALKAKAKKKKKA